ncbi:MlaD family protein [Nocardia brasiliensis]|uniref:MlaD family protein n=1 Tax=Nocardia brasiliensis TaxID=37326 RepID=UPI000691D9B7|nr:MlaD family protein [Nocardia brasiliensis]
MLTMHGLFAARGLVSALAVAAAAVIGGAAYLVLADPLEPTQRYCAELPDAIGLYPGSHVRVRGVPVGAVVAVRPENSGVRVDFDLPTRYAPHGEVGAVTVADTLVADRDLAVLPGPSDAAPWDARRCITRTLTPKSISETLQTIDQLARQLTTDDPQLLANTLRALRTATTGAGPQFDQLTTTLASVLRSPDAAVTQIGGLIDALAALSSAISANWGELEQVLTRFPAVFEQINDEIFGNLAGLVDSLRAILPWVNELTRDYGGVLLDGLDASIPYIRFIAANAGTIQQIIDRVPAVARAFTRVAGSGGAPVLTWIPPDLTLPEAAAEQACAAWNLLVPGPCPIAAGPRQVNVAELIAAAAGGR